MRLFCGVRGLLRWSESRWLRMTKVVDKWHQVILADGISKQPRLCLVSLEKGRPWSCYAQHQSCRQTAPSHAMRNNKKLQTNCINKLGCAMRISQYLVSLLLSTLPRIVHHPEHDAQRIYVLFMSWCLGRSKKGYVLFFGEALFCAGFPRDQKKTRHPGKPHKKTRHQWICLVFFCLAGGF